MFLKQGDLKKALGEEQEAIRKKPNYAAAHYNLGLVLSQLGKAAEAQTQFNQAHSLDPTLSH